MNIEHIAKKNPENEANATNHPFFLVSQTIALKEMFEGTVPEEEEVPQGSNLYGNTFSVAENGPESPSSVSHHTHTEAVPSEEQLLSEDIEEEIIKELEEMDAMIDQEVEEQFAGMYLQHFQQF